MCLASVASYDMRPDKNQENWFLFKSIGKLDFGYIPKPILIWDFFLNMKENVKLYLNIKFGSNILFYKIMLKLNFPGEGVMHPVQRARKKKQGW